MITRSAWIDPFRRGVAFGIALSLHFVFWILALHLTGHQPPVGQRDVEKPLQLVLLTPAATPRAPSGTSAVDATATRTRRVADHPSPRMPAAAVQATPAVEQAVPSMSPSLRLSSPSPTTHDAGGGFSERLRKARQRSRAAPQLPGTSVSRVPGIRLIDRDEQGIGALVRKTQRLFGITNRHCVDIDVWQHLTPNELSARHISPSDVERTLEAHHCNRPLGLSF